MIDNLLRLTRQVHELKVPLSTLISATRLNDFMKARGLNVSQLRDYLRMCDKHRKVFDNFVRKAIDLFLLEEETGKTYRYIQKEYVTLTQRVAELEQAIIKLGREKTNAEKKLDQELASQGLLRKEIPYAQKLKKFLEDYGFTLEEANKVPRFIEEIRAIRGGAEAFLKRADREETLEDEIIRLYATKKELEPMVERLTQQHDSLEEEVKRLSDKRQGLLETVDHLEKRNTSLNVEGQKIDAEISFTRWVVAILKNQPADWEALLSKLNTWKQLLYFESLDHVETREQSQQGARKIIIQTFLKYYGADLAPKDELTKAQKELEELKIQNAALSNENIEIKKTNEQLSSENTGLKKKLERANKEIEWYTERFVTDPSIKPKTPTELPFYP